jgi:TetR/AcrR family fatty acid metabolism transcriptional regulator
MPYGQAHVDTKQSREIAIFEAACHVIRNKGFHQARIVDIARQAGISYGLVYHYFRSKAHLFDAILKEWWTSLFEVIDRCEAEPSTTEGKLGVIVDYFLDLYETRPSLMHVFITEISRSSANLTPAHLEYFKVFFKKTEQIMSRGQAEGSLRGDVRARYLTYIFLGALEAFLSAMVLENQPFKGRDQKKRIAEGLLEVFFNGARSNQR